MTAMVKAAGDRAADDSSPAPPREGGRLSSAADLSRRLGEDAGMLANSGVSARMAESMRCLS